MLLRSLSILALNRCVNTRWVCICFFYFSPDFYRIFCMKSDILFVTIKEISMTQREELEKMQEILRDKIENTIPDYSTNGKCSRCGRCCSNLLSMTLEDVHRIRDYLQTHSITPAPLTRPDKFRSIPFDSCPFCDLSGKKATCMIYEARPAICRKFLCNADVLAKRYDINGDLVPDSIGQVDCRKTFFGIGIDKAK